MKIIYLPTIDYTFLRQRPQHLLSQATKRGHTVIYCNQTQVEGLRREEVEPNLWVYHDVNIAIKRNPDVDIFYATWAKTKDYINKVNAKITLFDNVDNFAAWKKDDEEFINTADIVLMASQPLMNLHQNKRNDLHLVRNACDFDLTLKEYKKPIEYENINKPILLVTGACGTWCDVGLMEKIPDKYQLVFVGQSFGKPIPKNALHIPSVSHDNLMSFIKYSDVCILPFDNSEVSYFSCPIKSFEYLSFGKPVCSTRIPASEFLSQNACVLLSKNSDEFYNNIDKAIELSKNEEIINRNIEFAKQHTWKHRWEDIEKAIYQFAESKGISL
jgi:teichuronic acid biosynthesis glycosyltransferase TuaH